MSIIYIICAMMLTAGASVRFVFEVSRKEIRPAVLVWKTLEVLALAWMFNYFA